MDTQPLLELGLTRTEASVYLAALKAGSATAGKIVEISGLQNAVVHRAFHSLIDKGLMSYSLEGKRKLYQAASPKRLTELLLDKQRQLQELVPKLEALEMQAVQSPVANTYEGIRGARELWNLMISEGDELLSYGAPEQSHNLLGDHFWRAHHRKRKERKIHSRHVFNSSFSWRGKQMPKESPTEVKYTDEGFESTTETAICADRVAIFIYLERPIGFLIHEPRAANSYRKFFEDIWARAKKMK